MITSAAVIIEIDGKKITIPCHRHGHVYQILKSLDYKPGDFRTISQGFIIYEKDSDDEWNGTERFVDRKEALKYALETGQITESLSDNKLYSEDLW